MAEQECPICQNYDFQYLGGKCTLNHDSSGNSQFDCTVCGKIEFTKEAYSAFLTSIVQDQVSFTRAKRALVSHRFKSRTRSEPENRNLIGIDDLDSEIFKVSGRTSLFDQMNNAVIYMEEVYEETGEGVGFLPSDIHAIIGSQDRTKAIKIFVELKDRGLLKLKPFSNGGRLELQSISLTFEGAKYSHELISAANQNELSHGFGREHALKEA